MELEMKRVSTGFTLFQIETTLGSIVVPALYLLKIGISHLIQPPLIFSVNLIIYIGQRGLYLLQLQYQTHLISC